MSDPRDSRPQRTREARRLDALRRLQVMDTPSDDTLDGIVQAVAALLDVPIALISLVDDHRQWWKAKVGLDGDQTPREMAFCDTVVRQQAPLIVRNTLEDERFHDNPLVTGEPHLRCYMGVPLMTSDGFVLGSLCGLDTRPRDLPDDKLDLLRSLADAAMSHIELRLAHRELRSSRSTIEEQWEFFEYSPDLHCVATLEGEFVRLNRPWSEVLGRAIHELKAHPIDHHIHPDDVEPTREVMRSLAQDNSVLGFRNRYAHRDGSYRWLEWNAFPLVSQNAVYATGRDITDQVEREAAQRDVSQRLADSVTVMTAILEAAPSVIYAKDADLRFTLSNRRHADLMGLKPAQIVGQTDEELFGDDAGDIEDLSLRVMQTRQPATSEFDLPIGDEVRTFHETIFPIHNDAGEPLGVAGIASDLTENRRSMRDLERLRATFETMLEASPVAIMLVTTDETVTMANPAARKICARDALEGLRLRELLDKRSVPATPPDPGEHPVEDAVVLLPDGAERPVELRQDRVELPGGEFSIVILVDITARKEIEHTLDDARRQAEAASRAKSSFLAHMSHEIRTPMNAVIGFAQLLRADPDLNAGQKDKIQTIIRAGDHLLTLVNQVLDMSVVESGAIQVHEDTIHLGDLVISVIEMFQEKAASKQITLRSAVSRDAPAGFYGDEGKLRQVLVNLVGNAIRVTEHGYIEIGARPLDLDGDACLAFWVEDTGPGIPAGDLARIFAPFEQTGDYAKRGGAGLGLAISQRYAQSFGGDLSATSEVGRGTRFTLRLPLRVAPIDALFRRTPSSHHRQLVQRADHDMRVLVIDDERDHLDLMTEMLGRVGFEVDRAEDGSTGLELAQRGDYDAIILDFRMPGLDGLQTAELLRGDHIGFSGPILLVSASVFEELDCRSDEVGIDVFLRKPVRQQALLSSLFELLGLEGDDDAPPLDEPRPPRAEQPHQARPIDPSTLDDDLHYQLLQAAQSFDYGGVIELADKIAPTHPKLAHLAVNCANSFNYEALLDLLHQG